MNRSRIPWLVCADGSPGYTWSPMSGCGPGLPCYERCWARAYHVRYRGGDFGVKLHPEKMDEPLRLRRPSTIGVCLMGDLFHPDVPASFRDDVFLAMAAAARHTFIVLTKRPAMAYAATRGRPNYLGRAWLGVSVEDQATADARIPVLLDTPAAHRWVSLEPQIGPVSFSEDWMMHLDGIIQGCESGPRRRDFDSQWARSVRAECAAAPVPYALKQRHGCVYDDCHCWEPGNECGNQEGCDEHRDRTVIGDHLLDGKVEWNLPWGAP